MKTTVTLFDTIPLVVPVFGESDLPLRFPYQTLESFGSYCGAGPGLGDKIVPEQIFGLKISPACYVHDVMYEVALPCWGEFHQANSVFLHNLLAIIEMRSANRLIASLRRYRAMTFYNAVDTLGAAAFWAVKDGQRKN